MDSPLEPVRLRLLDEGDVSLYRRLYTCPRVMAQIAPPLTDAAAEAAFVRVCRENRRQPLVHRTWAVEVDGRDAGIVSMRTAHAVGDIGLMLLPDAWDRRTAAGAIRAVLHHGFDDAGLTRIVADCRDGVNVRLLRRLLGPFGFIRLASSRSGYVDWALDRRDWRPDGAVALAIDRAPG